MMPVGSGEVLFIFVLVLILFGPDKLPDLARGIGKGMREIRKVTSEFQSQINLGLDDDDRRPVPRPPASRLVARDADSVQPLENPMPEYYVADHEVIEKTIPSATQNTVEQESSENQTTWVP